VLASFLFISSSLYFSLLLSDLQAELDARLAREAAAAAAAAARTAQVEADTWRSRGCYVPAVLRHQILRYT